MKKYFLLIFQFFIIISSLAAQSYVTLSPSNSSEKVPPVSKVGHYISVGTGLAIISPMTGVELNGSYSYAYKSHLFSVSGITSGTILNGGGSYESWFNFSSFGLLAGESLRARHWLLSASAGIGIADMKYHRVISTHDNNIIGYRGTSASLPAEIKLFFLTSHFGMGFHVFTDFSAKYKPYVITANLVFGNWRKPKE